MADRRSSAELAAAVLAAVTHPMTEWEIRERVRAPGGKLPNVTNVIRALVSSGQLRPAGKRHTLENGTQTLVGK